MYSSSFILWLPFKCIWRASSSKITTSSTQNTANARAMDPARNVFWSWDWALIRVLVSLSPQSILWEVRRAYFAIMLPGRAMLKVCDLPPRGVNMAVGFEVSTSMLPLDSECWPWLVFLF